MTIHINDDTMALEIGDRVVVTARFSRHAAGDGNGAWIVSTHPARLFSRDQTITALTLAERLAAGLLRRRLVRNQQAQGTVPVTDRLIRITTTLAVVAVAGVAAIISYQHAYELVTSHGETGLTARLLPFTVDGLIWAASMVVLDASRRNHRVPRLAAWSLGAGIVATLGANLAHGVSHGPIDALVSAWPALALVGSFELLKMLVRSAGQISTYLVPGLADPSHQAVPGRRARPAGIDQDRPAPGLDEIRKHVAERAVRERCGHGPHAWPDLFYGRQDLVLPRLLLCDAGYRDRLARLVTS
jgi:Protein of unknown function (DUF2637)